MRNYRTFGILPMAALGVLTQIFGYNTSQLRNVLFLNTVQARAETPKNTHGIIIPQTFKAHAWKLVWSDEFDYEGLPDPAKWGYEKGYVRNNELQYYAAARKENSRVGGGFLYITARKDNADLDGAKREITSASLTTSGRKTWKYGKVEVRAKVPLALGSWPAIWMLPNGREWPDGGEIDIMEQVGFEENKFHFNVHTKKYNGASGEGSKGKSVQLSERADGRFHVFALQWSEKRLEWLLDGRKVYSFENKGAYDVWPFDHDFYIILNLAFGGTWGGTKGVDKNTLPLEYVIDYVRVYQ